MHTNSSRIKDFNYSNKWSLNILLEVPSINNGELVNLYGRELTSNKRLSLEVYTGVSFVKDIGVSLVDDTGLSLVEDVWLSL